MTPASCAEKHNALASAIRRKTLSGTTAERDLPERTTNPIGGITVVGLENKQFFSVDEIAAVYEQANGDDKFPYGLRVMLKNGKLYATNYQTEQSRETSKLFFIRSIQAETNQRSSLTRIEDKIMFLEVLVKNLEKRQLKFGRLFKKMVPLLCKEEEIE